MPATFLKIAVYAPISYPKEALMSSPLSILIVEDNLADFERVAKELARFGFAAQCQRVATEADFAARLEGLPDVILAVDTVAGFGSLRALRGSCASPPSQSPSSY